MIVLEKGNYRSFAIAGYGNAVETTPPLSLWELKGRFQRLS
jgi:hypothetical protein